MIKTTFPFPAMLERFFPNPDDEYEEEDGPEIPPEDGKKETDDDHA